MVATVILVVEFLSCEREEGGCIQLLTLWEAFVQQLLLKRFFKIKLLCITVFDITSMMSILKGSQAAAL